MGLSRFFLSSPSSSFQQHKEPFSDIKLAFSPFSKFLGQLSKPQVRFSPLSLQSKKKKKKKENSSCLRQNFPGAMSSFLELIKAAVYDNWKVYKLYSQAKRRDALSTAILLGCLFPEDRFVEIRRSVETLSTNFRRDFQQRSDEVDKELSLLKKVEKRSSKDPLRLMKGRFRMPISRNGSGNTANLTLPRSRKRTMMMTVM